MSYTAGPDIVGVALTQSQWPASPFCVDCDEGVQLGAPTWTAVPGTKTKSSPVHKLRAFLLAWRDIVAPRKSPVPAPDVSAAMDKVSVRNVQVSVLLSYLNACACFAEYCAFMYT
jgi:hypothetical protein